MVRKASALSARSPRRHHRLPVSLRRSRPLRQTRHRAPGRTHAHRESSRSTSTASLSPSPTPSAAKPTIRSAKISRRSIRRSSRIACAPNGRRRSANTFSGDSLVVPPDHYFVMGDNRDDSSDSRYWGFVDRDAIMGRPMFIYWSVRATPDDYTDRSLSGTLFGIEDTLVPICPAAPAGTACSAKSTNFPVSIFSVLSLPFSVFSVLSPAWHSLGRTTAFRFCSLCVLCVSLPEPATGEGSGESLGSDVSRPGSRRGIFICITVSGTYAPTVEPSEPLDSAPPPRRLWAALAKVARDFGGVPLAGFLRRFLADSPQSLAAKVYSASRSRLRPPRGGRQLRFQPLGWPFARGEFDQSR